MNSVKVGEKCPKPKPCTPCLTAYASTLSEKITSRPIRTHAPPVGTHLPRLSETIALITAAQMNTSEKRYLAAPSSGVKKSPNTATAVIVKEPPSQIGLAGQ